MPNTFIKIATVTVGASGASSIDFTSIPQTFTDLKVVLSGRSSESARDVSCKMTFNSTTTTYANRYLYGNGTSASSGSDTQAYVFRIPASTATASVFGNGEVYIPNYTSSNNKSFSDDSVAENNATGTGIIFSANLWSNTAAITSIKIELLAVANFVQYTTATLYGITKA